jgi:YidC/Oxa1 family membrane protein insertase
MDIKKILLYFAVALMGSLIWVAWQKDYPSTPVKTSQATTQSSSPTAGAQNFTPPSYQDKKAAPATVAEASLGPQQSTAPAPRAEKEIHVKTDVLDLAISAKNGNVVSARLLKYPLSIHEKNSPMSILSQSNGRLYVAQSGLTNIGQKSLNFQSAQNSYLLSPTQKTLAVVVKSQTKQGLQITKTYTVTRGSYAVKQSTTVKNKGRKTWSGSFYNQLMQKQAGSTSAFSRSYTGAAISTHDKPYQKMTYKKLAQQDISQNIEGGWVAFQQPYFLSAWAPQTEIENHYYSRSFSDKGQTFILGYVGPQVRVLPGKSVTNGSTLYVGPEVEGQLAGVAKGLGLTIDYGWLWFLSKPIFYVMSKIHAVSGNWGWAIILVTMLIKLIFYPLSAKSYRSMAKMRELNPRLQALRERYANDKQALGKATMEFYKREKASPAGGCLPMLIQIPVFIALYYVLIESVELRQAPFIFWIHDLSVKDPFYVLPIIMGVSMFLQQRLSPAPPDPTQAKMMMFLPVVFTVFFLSFPAGLVLYWVTNNCLSILQQWYVMKSFDAAQRSRKRKK